MKRIVCLLLCGLMLLPMAACGGVNEMNQPVQTTQATQAATQAPQLLETEAPTEAPAETTQPVETTVPTEPEPVFQPVKTAASDPANWGVEWEILQNGAVVDSFQREQAIDFDPEEPYFALPGIASFRGDHLRSGATYGTAEISSQQIDLCWRDETGALADRYGGVWAGCGWTGQPLVVQWDEETKQIMNLYEDKKAKEGLVEVIYATLCGTIYFMDLYDGSYTRDPMYVGMCFKGSGALDPRGYPLMYVGSGDFDAYNNRPRMYVISLIDTTVLYEYGNNEPMQLRTDNDAWCAFDSSPLVHGETDTLIWPGENGILYTIKLNTQYDKAAGTISVNPEHVAAARYDTARSGSSEYWYGMEASASIVGSYLYVSENGGMFYCVDLNTMELVWAQDTLDDSNGSPVFEWISEEEAYVYTAPSLHWSRADGELWGTVHIYKLDALTGEIVWAKPYDVATMDGVSGGVQATGLLGKEGSNIEGLIIYPIARYGALYSGALVALDTETGEEVWSTHTQLYAWSSPVALYTEDGTAYIVTADAEGTVRLLDGATGAVLDTADIWSIVEASPVVFGNKLVVGTRGYMIHCLEVY